MTTATAQALADLAFITYWGNRNDALRLPSNNSISMNLDGLSTRTTVTFGSVNDSLSINGKSVVGSGLRRIYTFLDIVWEMAGMDLYAEVVSRDTIPSCPRIAFSVSAFAAPKFAFIKCRVAKLD